MPREDLKLAVMAAALSLDPRVVANLSRQGGFAGVQFDARSSSLDLLELSGTGRKEFRHMLGAQNQQLVGLRQDLGPKGLAPGADVDRELSRLGQVMETATGLGSPLVCVDLGPLPAPASVEAPKPKVTPDMAGLILLPQTEAEGGKSSAPAGPATPPDPAFISQLDAALAELGRMADRTSTVVAFRSDLSSLAALERALRKADCPWFGVDFDPVSVLSDAWTLDETFTRLGPSIRHVRGRDALAGTDRRTKPTAVGRGGTDWSHLLSNLTELGYAGWISIDPLELPDRVGAATSAAAYLRGLL